MRVDTNDGRTIVLGDATMREVKQHLGVQRARITVQHQTPKQTTYRVNNSRFTFTVRH